MKKMLHDRLRIWAKKDRNGVPILNEWMHYFGGTIDTPPSDCDIWDAIADEIERDYIPRPRYEDGEPARFGDELENGKRIATITYHIGGRCTINDTATCQGTVESDYELYDGETLKRPTPKVLDADGVEIKVGDTVWAIDGKISLEVLELDGIDGLNVRTYDGLDAQWQMSNKLTHERPVFDVDGMRIRKADEGWCVTNGAPCKVIGYDKKRNDLYVEWIDSEYICSWIEADVFTHREPDSLEKLRDDMSNTQFDEAEK